MKVATTIRGISGQTLTLLAIAQPALMPAPMAKRASRSMLQNDHRLLSATMSTQNQVVSTTNRFAALSTVK